MTRVPVFWPRASHCSSSESCIVFRLPEIPTFCPYFTLAAGRRQETALFLLFHGRVVGGDAGYGLPDDQRMNVVGALVGIDAFDIGEVAEDRVLVDHAIGAEGLARELGALPGHPDIVALGHRDVVR